MGKLITVALLLGSLMLLMSTSGSHAETRQQNESESRKEKITKLHFYMHDLFGWSNGTVWEVARSSLTDILPSQFGLVYVLDNHVTFGPELDSGEVGRMQGVVGFADLHERVLVMLLNFVFTKGEYKGSTLSISGRNPVDESAREVPIVGGTGVFKMARGYVITRTYSIDESQTHGVFEYNFVVYHFEDVGLSADE